MPDLWTDEEIETHTKKIINLSMPKKGEYIDMWDLSGRKFSGKVIQCRKNHFFIIETGTNGRAWIDLNRLNYWSYRDKTPADTESTEEDGNQSGPSLIMTLCVPFEDEYEV